MKPYLNFLVYYTYNDNTMKKITVIEYLKFQNIDKKNLSYENAYKVGYWNVFQYTVELENFLIVNEIKYKTEEN